MHNSYLNSGCLNTLSHHSTWFIALARVTQSRGIFLFSKVRDCVLLSAPLILNREEGVKRKRKLVTATLDHGCMCYCKRCSSSAVPNEDGMHLLL